MSDFQRRMELPDALIIDLLKETTVIVGFPKETTYVPEFAVPTLPALSTAIALRFVVALFGRDKEEENKEFPDAAKPVLEIEAAVPSLR